MRTISTISILLAASFAFAEEAANTFPVKLAGVWQIAQGPVTEAITLSATEFKSELSGEGLPPAGITEKAPVAAVKTSDDNTSGVIVIGPMPDRDPPFGTVRFLELADGTVKLLLDGQSHATAEAALASEPAMEPKFARTFTLKK